MDRDAICAKPKRALLVVERAVARDELVAAVRATLNVAAEVMNPAGLDATVAAWCSMPPIVGLVAPAHALENTKAKFDFRNGT